MLILQTSETELMNSVVARMKNGFVGLIYLDIAKFREIEQTKGREYCENVLHAIKNAVLLMEQSHERLFASKRVGDDFFLYLDYDSSTDKLAYSRLKEDGSIIERSIEKELRDLFDIEPSIDLHTGTAMLVDMPGRLPASIVYEAMKIAIRTARRESSDHAYEDKLRDFYDIMRNQSIYPVYQPIVSLADSSILGYEALTRGPEGHPFHSPKELFAFAEREGWIYDLEQMAREKAIAGCAGLSPDQRVFINISAEMIHDSRFMPGKTLKLLKECGIEPRNVVFEITERSSVEDFSTAKKILEHYRNQGYQIAIDDAGAGYSSLQAIAELQPDYIKVDRSLVHNIFKDKIKESILETLVSFAHKMNIRIIAEGIESEDELYKLLRMGVHFGQGYYLGRPGTGLQPFGQALCEQIQRYRTIYSMHGDYLRVGDLISSVATFSPEAPVSELVAYFNEHTGEEGAVIARDGKPTGIVMKSKLFQQLANQYGYSLYSNKAIDQLMDRKPLVVDEHHRVDAVSQLAMMRDTVKLYDIVAVTREARLLGAVSVRTLLETITNERLELARLSNPLTGLPGNAQIQRELNRRLSDNLPFTLIYADLDYFKWYNDQFGFQQGDKFIQFTADVLLLSVNASGTPDDFVGHIGGDDFVIISRTGDPEQLCSEIIRRFDRGSSQFYGGASELMVEDREGKPVDAAGVTISLSLIVCESPKGLIAENLSAIAADLKKRAKQVNGCSCCKIVLNDEASA